MKSLENDTEIYKKIYDLGYNDKLASIEELGFKSAFVNNKLIIPNRYKNFEDAVDSFKKGFNNINEAVEIKKRGFCKLILIPDIR